MESLKTRMLGHLRLRRRSDYPASSSAIVALLLVGLGVLATTVVTAAAVNQHARDMQLSRQQHSARLAHHIQEQLADYEQLLLAAASAMKAHSATPAMTRDEWRQLVANLEVHKRHQEILGMGYAAYIPAGQLPQHIANVRAQGFPDYTIAPDTPRDEYTAILYLEPFDGVNKRAFGYDMFSDSVRRQSMSLARDTAESAISAPVTLVQDAGMGTDNQSQGILMYYPVYNGAIPDTVDARRQALAGYAYIAFRVRDMMSSADLQFADGNYRLVDTSDGAPAPLFDRSTGNVQAAAGQPGYKLQITAINRTWQSELYLKDSYINRLVDPLLTFTLGLICSILLGAGAYVLLSRRMRIVHRSHQREIQRTKDELLALTSHQLRTPATGVKQYLGMLLHGYFGALDDEQASIMHKAYAANERQLEIIDQLLYVAKADAGQILLVPERFDMAILVQEVIDGFYSAANSKSLVLELKSPRRLRCVGDPRYIRMIAENLVSNAIKYSYPGASIHITLTSKAGTIRLAVRDTGVGIDAKDLPKLFQKFGRIENPLSRAEGGSGLGLFLANKLARAHHGTIEVRSRVGSGSTFTLTLPRRQPRTKNVAQLTD